MVFNLGFKGLRMDQGRTVEKVFLRVNQREVEGIEID
jgi:hypothetical protein